MERDREQCATISHLTMKLKMVDVRYLSYTNWYNFDIEDSAKPGK